MVEAANKTALASFVADYLTFHSLFAMAVIWIVQITVSAASCHIREP